MDQVQLITNQFVSTFKNYFTRQKVSCQEVQQENNKLVIKQNKTEINMDKTQRKELQKSLHEIARNCEKQVLSHSGLDISKDLLTMDVTIKKQEEDEQWIHTLVCGKDEKKPKLVLLHGYTGKPLSKKYEVYAIDLPGMGLSSKPEWNFEGPEPAISFFVDYLEEWRKQMNLEKFTLVGHSLGGYISGNYALNHPERLEKLILLSSAGVTRQTKEEIQQHMDNIPIHHKLFFKVFDYVWNNRLTINKLYSDIKSVPTSAEIIMKQYIKLLNLPNHEFEPWTQYMDKMLSLPESSEKCIFNILQYPRFNAILPLEELFPKGLKVPVHFCYGGKLDWMCSSGARNLINNKLVEGTFTQIDHFDHQFTFYNPKETANYILNL